MSQLDIIFTSHTAAIDDNYNSKDPFYRKLDDVYDAIQENNYAIRSLQSKRENEYYHFFEVDREKWVVVWRIVNAKEAYILDVTKVNSRWLAPL